MLEANANSLNWVGMKPKDGFIWKEKNSHVKIDSLHG